jgi:hypothetical protein
MLMNHASAMQTRLSAAVEEDKEEDSSSILAADDDGVEAVPFPAMAPSAAALKFEGSLTEIMSFFGRFEDLFAVAELVAL